MMGKPSIIFSDAKLQQNAVITNKKPKFFFLHRFCVSLQRTNSKSYGKEPIKQVRLAGGNHLPTFDFQQEILSMGSDIEVLSPKWFREDTAERVKAMWNKYKEG